MLPWRSHSGSDCLPKFRKSAPARREASANVRSAPLPDLISRPKAGHSEAGDERPVPAPPWAPGRLVREPLVQDWEGARRGIDPEEGTETLPTFAFRDAELQQVLRPLSEVPLHLCVVSLKRAD